MSFSEKVKALFGSRRFWAAVGAVLEVVFHDLAGLTAEQSMVVAGILASWVVGDSIQKTGQ